jgi:FtsP/CotA-like multicopper oxidase with cupredoxin domain
VGRGVLRLVARGSALALLLIVAGGAGARAAELTFDIRIEHGRIPDAMHLMRVHEGDSVTLRWTSDRPVILHLHGYDIEKRVAPDAVTELAFTAYATGRFPIEIHAPGAGAGIAAHEEAPLAIVEVYPR